MATSFQDRVQVWMRACFKPEDVTDTRERNHRFGEEALELMQSKGCTGAEAHMLVDYVFGRPPGDPRQEVGGVLLTLAALCTPAGIDMADAGEAELARVNRPEMLAKIRAKHDAKPRGTPLPGASSDA